MTRASQAAPPCLMRLQGGAGPDLVLIHGFGSDRTSWAANVQALAAGSTVHAVDLPGHGDAGPDVGDGRIETLADSVEAALDRLAGGPVSLIGHSLGGGIALMLAARRPDRIRSLVLIAPAGLGRAVDPTFLRDYPHLREAGETEALLRRLVAKPRLINRQLVTLVQRQLQAPGRREALAGIARGLAAAIPDLRTAAATVVQGSLPRLTIWGEDDVINPHDADALAEFGGDACVIPGVGHLPQVEAAATVNARIAAFLNYTVVPVT